MVLDENNQMSPCQKCGGDCRNPIKECPDYGWEKPVKKEAPNFRRTESCATCEYGCLVPPNKIAGIFNVMIKCDKYGFMPPGGICDDFEED